MMIDMTSELAGIVWGMLALLAVSAAGIVAPTCMRRLARRLVELRRRRKRRRRALSPVVSASA